MANEAATEESVLVVSRSFEAPREAVFDAWLDAAQLAQWMGPHGVRAEIDALEPKVGGRYRIIMHPEPGGTPTAGGVYREISRPDRLVFTWAWENAHPDGSAGVETIITVTFENKGGKTEMTLRQEGLESTESRDSHRHGWDGSFDKLADTLS
ncbi:MAG: SRPBCC domain-containing protein [Micropepsaceae bacterium]